MWLDDPFFPPAAALLPLAWAGLYAFWRRGGRDRADAFARATVVWGAAVTLLVELQSALGLLHPAGVTVSWAAATAAVWALAARRPHSAAPGWTPEPGEPAANRILARALAAATAAAALVLGVAAWRVPVRSWDAIGYHLPRVMHWAQNGSIAHYPTADPRPLFMGPWTGQVQLELYLLAGSDRLANLVQWAAMAGSLAAAAALARALGGGRLAQAAAAALVASIPLGVAQATTSMIDYTATLWTLVFALVALPPGPRPGAPPAPGWLAGGALGLALLTKATTAPVVAPIALLYGWRALRRRRLAAWRPALAAAAAIVLLNLPHTWRNVATFGHPAGPPAQRSLTVNESFHPRFVASNLVRHTFANLGTWSPAHGARLTALAGAIHRRLGVADGDPRNSYVGQVLTIGAIEWGADPPGNLFHLALYLLLVPVALFRRPRRPELDAYGLALAAGALFFCVLVKYQLGIPRLQLPLFALAAPWASLVLSRAVSPRLAAGAAALALLLSVQWIGFAESCRLAGPDGIFRRPRSELAYRWAAHHAYSLRSIARATANRHADGLGLTTDGLVLEYNVWREVRALNLRMPPVLHLAADGYGEPLPVPPPADRPWPRFLIWYRAADPSPAELTVAGRRYVIAGRWGGTAWAYYVRR